MNTRLRIVVALVFLSAHPKVAEAIPYFARKYGVSCAQCHVAPPKLNSFGEAFIAAGYENPGLTARRTWPFALWISGRSESLAGVPDDVADRLRAYMNRVEVIAGGKAGAPWLTYFVEWRPLSVESRGNGTLRDRSGRFEDLFLTASRGGAELTAGQFRQIGQVDVSRRLGLSEPLLLGGSLAGAPGGSSREVSLRGFAPAGRSPALRASWNAPVAGGWRWTTAAGLPVPGEFSIPLNEEAKVEASNEIEWRPKGALLESFVRRGLSSFGGHVFFDDSDRYLANAIGTGNVRKFYWTGLAGAAKRGGILAGQWSVEGEYVPHSFVNFGGRVENRAADGADIAYLPYINAHFPGTRYTVRLTVERRIQRDRNATFVELGTIF